MVSAGEGAQPGLHPAPRAGWNRRPPKAAAELRHLRDSKGAERGREDGPNGVKGKCYCCGEGQRCSRSISQLKRTPSLLPDAGIESTTAKEKLRSEEVVSPDNDGSPRMVRGSCVELKETQLSRRITERSVIFSSASREDLCKIKSKCCFFLSDFCQLLGAAPYPCWKIFQYFLNCFTSFQQVTSLEGVYLSWYMIMKCLF